MTAHPTLTRATVNQTVALGSRESKDNAGVV
jgi:hypothetical protein